MGHYTTVEADPEGAASFLRALKQRQAEQKSSIIYEHKEEAASNRPGWFQTSQNEVEEKLGRKTIWDMGPSPRGTAYEKLRGAYPASNLQHVDDIKLEARTVTGMKSIELRDPTYQDIKGLDRRVRNCIDELDGYPGGRWNKQPFYRGIHFDDVYLELGIPTGVANPEQTAKLLELQGYAQTQNVTLVINEVP